MLRRFALLLSFAFLALSLRAADLMVFAAASLSDALTEIARDYPATGGDTVKFNFASSSMLARQIKAGAPTDVFFSADEAKMDDLAQAKLIVPETRRSLLTNTLVIVVNAEHGAAVHSPADLATATVSRLALGETATVPAGIYAREYLQKAGLWEKVSTKVAGLESVRAALAAVESGNADAGIVYKTDALISQHVKIACEIAAAAGPKISYPLAVVKDSKNPAAAQKFADYLASPAAYAVFERYGFHRAP